MSAPVFIDRELGDWSSAAKYIKSRGSRDIAFAIFADGVYRAGEIRVFAHEDVIVARTRLSYEF